MTPLEPVCSGRNAASFLRTIAAMLIAGLLIHLAADLAYPQILRAADAPCVSSKQRRLHGCASTPTTGPVFPATLGAGWTIENQPNLTIPASPSLQACCSFTLNILLTTTTRALSLWRQGPSNFSSGFAISYYQPDDVIRFITFPVPPNAVGRCENPNYACVRPGLLNDGKLHMFTVVFNSSAPNAPGTLEVYVDGVSRASVRAATRYFPAATEPIRPLLGFNGAVYLMQWFSSRAWTAGDVSAMYSAVQKNALPSYSSPLNSGIAGYWAGPLINNRILDLSGNSNTIYLDTVPPIAAATEPTNGRTGVGVLSLKATASDPDGSGVHHVQMQIDGQDVCAPIAASPYICEWDSGSGAIVDGKHSFSVIAVDNAGNSVTSPSVHLTTRNGVFSKTWYYSATSGRDENNCLSASTPCKTIGRLNRGHYREGDQILLNAADGAFSDSCLKLSRSNATSAPTFPITLGAYNGGKWQLTAPCTGSAEAAVNVNGVDVVVQDCLLRAAAPERAAKSGIWFHNDMGKNPISVTAQRCDIGNFHDLPSSLGGNILLTGYPGPRPAALSPVQILNNTLCGTSGPSSEDDNGISGFGFETNIRNVTITGNTICNIGGRAFSKETNGIGMGGYDGGTVSFNLLHDIGYNNYTCGGPYGILGVSTRNMIIEFSEIYRVRSEDPIRYMMSGSCDHGGMDGDNATQNTVFQDYYTHNNYGPGTLIYQGFLGFSWSRNTFRYMVSENDGEIAAYGANGLGGLNFVPNQDLATVAWTYNNTIFNDVVAYSSLNPGPGYQTVRTGGTGGTPGMTTFTLTAGVCPIPPQVKGTIDGNGVLTGSLTVTNPGQCSSPRSTSGISCAQCGLTGATVNALFNSGCFSGVSLGGSAPMTAIIANNILSTGKCSDNQFGAGSFTPIRDTFSGRSQSIQFVNNDMSSTNGGQFDIKFSNVDYTAIAAFESKNSGSFGNILKRPIFFGPLPSGNCTWMPTEASRWPPSGCATAYALNKGDPLLTAGLNLTKPPFSQSAWSGGVPTRDYFGGTAPNSANSMWYVGAHGGTQ
jgi:hypothetical protein